MWLVKTHSRFETADQGGAFAQFEAQRAILLVRHPLKVVTSFWHFVLANERQDRSVPASTFTTFSRIWDVFISRVGAAWGSFHRFWLTRPLPLLVLRYEELTSDRAAVLQRLYDFLYAGGAADAAPALRRLECMKAQGASAPSYYTPRAHAAAEADIFTANQTRRLLQSLRTELCILGYGRPRGRLNESGSELATVRCSKAELSALRRGAAAQLLGEDVSAAPPAAAGSGLTLNRGNAGCGASRRRKPPKHTAPSVPGPAGMACGASLSTAAKAPDKMLQHPFQALACVRQAARARQIDISSWDLAPGA